MPRRSHLQARTTWKKRYATRLVTIDQFDTAIDVIKKLKSALGADVCVEIVRNV
jgi:hypothetical protein